MMDFIMVPIVVGIVCAGIYGLFELFVRRKERLRIIEKIGDKPEVSVLDDKFEIRNYIPHFPFGALKAGFLMAGIGLGLLVGFLVHTSGFDLYEGNGWYQREITGVIYGSSVLLFGGIALVIAFLIEMKITKKK